MLAVVFLHTIPTLFCLTQNMIHIADTKVARRYGDFFIRQIHKFEEVRGFPRNVFQVFHIHDRWTQASYQKWKTWVSICAGVFIWLQVFKLLGNLLFRKANWISTVGLWLLQMFHPFPENGIHVYKNGMFHEIIQIILIAGNPPGFPGNLPDFDTYPGSLKKIPDFEVCATNKKTKNRDHFFDFVRDCGN